MRTFMELARERYSVRSYSPRPIGEEQLQTILRAGQVAPTAVNHQPQKILVLRSPEALATIRSLSRSAYNAPVVLLVCYDERLCWKSPYGDGHDSGEMDASIVCTHMMLQAAELGIGSVWVLLFDPQQVKQAFQLPESLRPVCLLPLGYPAEDSHPHAPMHDSFRPLGETVEYR